MNNNFNKRRSKAHVHKKYTKEATTIMRSKSKKFTRSTILEEEKLGTNVTAQSKRDIKKKRILIIAH
jgi:hypothetical protein